MRLQKQKQTKLLFYTDYYKRRRCPVPLRTKTAVTPEVTEQMHERRTGKTLYDEAGVSQTQEPGILDTHSNEGIQPSFLTHSNNVSN